MYGKEKPCDLILARRPKRFQEKTLALLVYSTLFGSTLTFVIYCGDLKC